MATLEQIKVGCELIGLVSNETVLVLEVKRFNPAGIGIKYKTNDGHTYNQTLSQEMARSMTVLERK